MSLSKEAEKIAITRLAQIAQTIARLTAGEQGIKLGPAVCHELTVLKQSAVALAHHIQGRHSSKQCIYCGCTEDHACIIGGDAPRPCSWLVQGKVCDNPGCARRHRLAEEKRAKK